MTTSIDEVTVYVEVVEQGSFSAAADRLGLSTSVVSKRVRALEERLATQLLQRTTRKLTMTQSGELFYESLREIPRAVQAAEEKVRELSGKIEGELKVLMPTFFESSLLHDVVIPAYLTEHPKIHLSIKIVANPLDHLRDDFHLIVVGKLPHRRFPDTSHKGRRLLKLRGALFATPSYLEEHGTPAHPSELDQHNCLSYLNQEWHFTEPSGEQLVIKSRGNLRTNSNQLLRSSTLAGQGIAYSFPAFFVDDIRKKRVVRLLDQYTEKSYVDIHIFYPSTSFVPLKTRSFIETLLKTFSTSDP